MHRGLKIRGGFLAKHIFGFAEHKALEKSRVCQTRRAAARFAEPPSDLPTATAGVSGQELDSTRGPANQGQACPRVGGSGLPSSQHLVCSEEQHEVQPVHP